MVPAPPPSYSVASSATCSSMRATFPSLSSSCCLSARSLFSRGLGVQVRVGPEPCQQSNVRGPDPGPQLLDQVVLVVVVRWGQIAPALYAFCWLLHPLLHPAAVVPCRSAMRGKIAWWPIRPAGPLLLAARCLCRVRVEKFLVDPQFLGVDPQGGLVKVGCQAWWLPSGIGSVPLVSMSQTLDVMAAVRAGVMDDMARLSRGPG